MSKNKSTDQYEVGYGRPPKNTQFKKGLSGNPKGRPRKPVDFGQQFLREARLSVVINENGRTTRISKFDVSLRQLIHKAMKGDVNAMKLLFRYYQQASEQVSLLAAQQARDAENETGKTAKDLSDDMLAKIIFASQAEKELEEESTPVLHE